MVFKCKMCGGTIEFRQGETVGVCDSCGTKQTLPRLDDDKKANLYDRANHFRRNNEFDKAMGIYEQILNEDGADAEAYWSLVLCRYGIEYVEDPQTHKRVPTVNRAQFTSIYMDEDYKSALQYADGYQRQIYEEEAKAIDDIQKGILEISSKEEPFDVFICYKETDNNGRRTQDSVLANDLYHQLVQEGFKVFFARITLEDKLGSAYEPYIFAALNSAKVMVVLGSKPEYFNAVWVKNEWSRYLALVKNSNGKKMLIPAYKDMDPYDLPEEFSHLQAQDMSKLGFMQDLIRGIKKIVGATSEKPAATKETVVINNGNANVAPLLKRAFMFLEDGNFEEADEYCEKVLDQDPENAQAYLGKLLASVGVPRVENLSNCKINFLNNINYNKVTKFGDAQLVSTLKDYANQAAYNAAVSHIESINNTEVSDSRQWLEIEKKFKNIAKEFKNLAEFKDSASLAEVCLKSAEAAAHYAVYVDLIRQQQYLDHFINSKDATNTSQKLKELAEKFNELADFKDSATHAKECIHNAEEAEKFGIYTEATNKMMYGDEQGAINLFQQISGWRDVDEQIRICQVKLAEKAAQKQAKIKAENAQIAAKKRKKTITTIIFLIVVAIIIFLRVILPLIVYAIDQKNQESKELQNDNVICRNLSESEIDNIES